MFFSEFFLAELGFTPPSPKYKRVYERKEGFLSGWECIFLNVSASASSQLGLVRRYGSRWSPGARRLQIWTEPHSSQTTPHSIIDSFALPQKSSRSRPISSSTTRWSGQIKIARREKRLLRGQVRWAAVGSLVSSDHQAKDVLIHLHLFKTCVFYMSWYTSSYLRPVSFICSDTPSAI